MQEIENSDVSMIYKNVFGSANKISPISVSDEFFMHSETFGILRKPSRDKSKKYFLFSS